MDEKIQKYQWLAETCTFDESTVMMEQNQEMGFEVFSIVLVPNTAESSNKEYNVSDQIVMIYFRMPNPDEPEA